MGIPEDAVDFYAELELSNDRDWWLANHDRWQTVVREPMQELCAALELEFGPAKLFRPNRDVRFSNDKSPYKTHQGAVVGSSPGVGLYVQINSRGLFTAGGWHGSTPDQVQAYREAVLGPVPGGELAEIVGQLEAADYEIDGQRLKTAPRGVAPDHERIELLRHRSLTASFDHGVPLWLDTPELVERVAQDWRAYTPLLNWLDEHLVVEPT